MSVSSGTARQTTCKSDQNENRFQSDRATVFRSHGIRLGFEIRVRFGLGFRLTFRSVVRPSSY